MSGPALSVGEYLVGAHPAGAHSMGVYLAEACRWFVMIALLFAALGKSLHFQPFRDSLGDAFPGFGRVGALVCAVAILAGEWLAGLLILAGGEAARIGLLLALVLFLALTAAVSSVLARGLSIRCNCFGASRQPITGLDVVRNLLFIAATGVALHDAAAGVREGVLGGLPWPVVLSTIAVALSVFLLSIHLRDLAQLLRFRAEDL
jgi:hypothetical protein